MRKQYPDQKRLLEVFEYRDGEIYRRRNSLCHQNKGRKAGGPNGRYRSVWVDGRQYYLHKIIFIMHHGYCPVYTDHADRDSFNNRIENLRDVTASQNTRNSMGRKDRTTKYKGVNVNSNGAHTFRAFIGHENKVLYLGSFKTQEGAARAYNAAAEKYHGKYAVLNVLHD